METITNGCSDGGRTSSRGSDELLDGVKEIIVNKKPVDEKIFLEKIDGWDEWQ